MRSRALKISGFAASFLALFFLLGGHWFAFQSVAWARMFADFSRHDSFRMAVAKTFDGKHLCKMCRSIQNGRQDEQKEERKHPLIKTEAPAEFLCDFSESLVPAAPTASSDAAAFVPGFCSDFIESPASPPPRSFVAVL